MPLSCTSHQLMYPRRPNGAFLEHKVTHSWCWGPSVNSSTRRRRVPSQINMFSAQLTLFRHHLIQTGGRSKEMIHISACQPRFGDPVLLTAIRSNAAPLQYRLSRLLSEKTYDKRKFPLVDVHPDRLIRRGGEQKPRSSHRTHHSAAKME